MSVEIPTKYCPDCRIKSNLDRMTPGGTEFWVCPSCADEIRAHIGPEHYDEVTEILATPESEPEVKPSPVTCGYKNETTGTICSRIVDAVGERCWQHPYDDDDEVNEE